MPLLRQGDFAGAHRLPGMRRKGALYRLWHPAGGGGAGGAVPERPGATGFGTQRVEEELAELFPNARVLRMDQDSTSQKNAHENMLAAFARGEYDIMLGTQMVAKGLDFEKVTLVGVLGIDSLLFSQGFRAVENVFSLVTQVIGRSGRAGAAGRALIQTMDPEQGFRAVENVFSLVTQVIGRSGRAGAAGRALIQTMDPENSTLNLAAAQNYEAFFEQEIMFRKICLYPPFCSVCIAAFSGADENRTMQAAARFARLAFLQRLHCRLQRRGRKPHHAGGRPLCPAAGHRGKRPSGHAAADFRPCTHEHCHGQGPVPLQAHHQMPQRPGVPSGAGQGAGGLQQRGPAVQSVGDAGLQFRRRLTHRAHFINQSRRPFPPAHFKEDKLLWLCVPSCRTAIPF